MFRLVALFITSSDSGGDADLPLGQLSRFCVYATCVFAYTRANLLRPFLILSAVRVKGGWFFTVSRISSCQRNKQARTWENSKVGIIVVSSASCWRTNSWLDVIKTHADKADTLRDCLGMGCCCSKNKGEPEKGDDSGDYIAKQNVTVWEYHDNVPEGKLVAGEARLEVKRPFE